MQINISIMERRACITGDPCIVCGNSDYVAAFTFDSEWDEYEEKTARFQYMKDGKVEREDVEFTGSACAIPPLYGICRVEIGVVAGSIRTTTPAVVPCLRCVTDIPAVEAETSRDIYNELCEAVQEALNPVPEPKPGYVFIVTSEGDYVTTAEGDYVIARE